MKEFHLVSSAGAGGSMRAAFPHAQVFCSMDDFGLGPLDDGLRRDAFWRALVRGYDGEHHRPAADQFAPWRALQSTLSLMQAQGCRIHIWHSASGSEYVFLRMACHWLADSEHALLAVAVPAQDGIHATAAWPPEQLREMLVDAVAISSVQRLAYAEEFSAIAARPGMLREFDNAGRLHFRQMNVHDDLLLTCCTSQWENAATVVGEAMGRSDTRNAQGDVFWSSRLQYLIDAGLIEIEGDRAALGKYRVRRT